MAPSSKETESGMGWTISAGKTSVGQHDPKGLERVTCSIELEYRRCMEG